MAEKPILSFYGPDLVLHFDLGLYNSLRWRRKYFEPGEIELHTSPAYFTRVQRGQLILRPDRPKEAARVEGVSIKNGDLVITGRFLESMLQDAAITSLYNFNGLLEAAMRQLVAEQYGRVPRVLPLRLGPLQGHTERIQAQVSLKNLLTVEEAMAKAGGLGFRVYPDPAQKCLFFEVYKGVDRTEGQAQNARVVFSDTYHNIDSPEYSENEAAYKNYAIVCGEGEGADRVIVEVDRTNGEDRRELLVDARDLSKGERTAAEYQAELYQRGCDKLDENALVRNFETGIKSSSQFRYMVDWDLGDIITGEQTEWGMKMDQRATEIEEVYENDAMSVTPTLGTPAPETYNLEDNIG